MSLRTPEGYPWDRPPQGVVVVGAGAVVVGGVAADAGARWTYTRRPSARRKTSPTRSPAPVTVLRLRRTVLSWSPSLTMSVCPLESLRTTVTFLRVSSSVRFTDCSAASRNATARTMPRSKRLTRPSSGSPARSPRCRARGETREVIASGPVGGRQERPSSNGALSSPLRLERRGDVLEVGQVLGVEPVADERDRERDGADEQADDGDAEGDAEVLRQLGDVALG